MDGKITQQDRYAALWAKLGPQLMAVNDALREFHDFAIIKVPQDMLSTWIFIQSRIDDIEKAIEKAEGDISHHLIGDDDE